MYAYIKNGVIDCISHEVIEIPDAEIIEYQDTISNPMYSNGEIIEYVDEEKEKKYRIYQSLITTPDISTVDLEGIIFTDKEIGDIILERVFEGNPHGQSAMLAKTSAYLMSVMTGDSNEELLSDIQAKQARINEVRAKFNLCIL